MYSSFAQYYDELDESRIENRNKLLDLIPKGDGKALDMACGTGLSSIKLKEKGGKVTALDISKDMIREARKKDNAIEWVIGDCSRYQFKEPFDLILLSANVLNHFFEEDDLARLFDNICRNLKEGATLVFDLPEEERFKSNNQLCIWNNYYVISEFDDDTGIWQQIALKDGNKDTLQLKHWYIEDVLAVLNSFPLDDITIHNSEPFYTHWVIRK